MLGELRPEVLADWMGRASIYALPARYEPFGLSVLEAALCDAVLVLGDVPSLREIWRDAAVYVPPRRPDLLGVAIDSLADDPFRRRAMAAAARSRALQLTPERMAAGYYALYNELTGARVTEICA
jgi:glycosyltransferase involved in cell wall biosynthesis